MADLRLSELIQRTPNGQEYFEVIIPPFSPGTNRKVLLSDLSAIIGGGGTWGSISGTLSNQTDLQAALNNKISLQSRTALSLVSTTLTINMNSEAVKYFNVATTINANTTLAMSNTTNAVAFTLHFKLTGARNFTFPSDWRMQEYEEINGRYDNAGPIVLTLTGTTDTPFIITGEYDGTVWKITASDPWI